MKESTSDKAPSSEKLSALRTEEALGARAARADRPRTLAALGRVGQGNPPMAGDELPGPVPDRQAAEGKGS